MMWQRGVGRAAKDCRLAKTLFAFVLFGFVFLSVLPSAQAKDMTNRLGIGFKNQFSENLPSIGVQYYPANDISLSAALGVDTADNDSKFGFMVRLNKIIFQEDNLNFYMGAGAGLLSIEQPGGNNDSGFELAGFAGAEFFFTGLDSLGFMVETGAAITSISSGVRFRTFGDSPIRAGIFFYF